MPVLCKINELKDMNELEARVLGLLNDKDYKNFPKLYSSGVVQGK